MPDNQSGNVELNTGGDAAIGRDVSGRDHITTNTTIHNYAPQSQHRRSELPNLPYFFGREEELAKIAETLDPEANGWGVLIDGPGGIGKTSLAIRAGQLASEQHYPSKIFLSAKVRELTPQGEQKLADFMLPNYMELLAELARELGDDDIGKINPNERANEVRRALENRQALIIIDNLETFEETERERLFQFLRRLPRSCKAIVTSRRRTDVAAEIIRLDRLTQKAAFELMDKLAVRNKLLARTSLDDRQRLYETAGGNPLLMEWIVGQLGRPESRCYTILEACQFLNSAPPSNDPLDYVFGDLLETFTNSQMTVLASLSHSAWPVTVEWIAEMAGMAPAVVQTALDDLADRALLLHDPATETYLMPPTVAVFLRNRRPEIVVQTGSRLTEHVMTLVEQILEDRTRIYEFFPRLEADWPTISAGILLFLQSDSSLLQLLCAALDRFLEFSGRLDDWLGLNLKAEERFRAANDLINAGWRIYWAGHIYRLRGQAADAFECIQRTEDCWNASLLLENGSKNGQATIKQLRGSVQRLQNDYAAAQANLEDALSIFRDILPDGNGVTITLTELALVEQMRGNTEAAERYCLEALEIAERMNYREEIASSNCRLAYLMVCRFDWLQAEELAHKSLHLAEAIMWQEYIAHSAYCLAKALAGLGRYSEGLPHAWRAVDIYSRLRLPELGKAQAVLRECGG